MDDRIRMLAPVALWLVSGVALAAEPSLAELLERMNAYETQVRQLEQRVEQAEQRAQAAETALARLQPAAADSALAIAPAPTPSVTAGEVPPAAAGASPQPTPVLVAATPVAVRHYKDKSIIPHGESDGRFPNAWPIPGTDSYVAIGGYVKADVIQDFDAVGNQNQFATNTIAIDGTPNADLGGKTTLNARETRLNIDFHKPSELGPLRAFVEGDFFGDSNAFRLRHGYGQIGGLLFGQTWTTFADLATHPYTLDFEGPDASVMRRTPQIRYGGALAPGWSWAAALEEPGASIANVPGFSGADRSKYPDLPGFVRYQGASGAVQLAGVVRQVRFDGQSGDGNEADVGYGAGLSFTRSLFDGDVLSGQFVYGAGIANYVQGLSGQGVDAALGANGKLETVTTASGMLAYTHHWQVNLRSVLSVSLSDVDDESGLSPGSIDRLQDVHANLIWSPLKALDLGAEIMWGERRDQDGADGQAARLQFSARYQLD